MKEILDGQLRSKRLHITGPDRQCHARQLQPDTLITLAKRTTHLCLNTQNTGKRKGVVFYRDILGKEMSSSRCQPGSMDLLAPSPAYLARYGTDWTTAAYSATDKNRRHVCICRTQYEAMERMAAANSCFANRRIALDEPGAIFAYDTHLITLVKRITHLCFLLFVQVSAPPISSLPQFLAIDEKGLTLDLEDTAVAHIRGGDIINKPGENRTVHSAYNQPPCSYYREAFLHSNASRLVIVAEDNRNPCVGYLRDAFPDRTEHLIGESVMTSTWVLVRAQVLILACSSFASMALLAPISDVAQRRHAALVDLRVPATYDLSSFHIYIYGHMRFRSCECPGCAYVVMMRVTGTRCTLASMLMCMLGLNKSHSAGWSTTALVTSA
jgi:hypothetical protein